MKTQDVTRSLKLPFQFDEEKLLNDLELVMKNKWVPHFNTNGYEGNWNSIPLYAREGDETNIFVVNNEDTEIVETSVLKNCLYFKEVIHHFECRFFAVRLLRLSAGSFIKPHRDHKLGYEDHAFRIHIPIITNQDVSFILDGERLEMLAGECWYTNVNYVHSVANKGKTDRIHLVIDGERNEWSDKLFFSLAPKESFMPAREDQYAEETIRNMIEELKKSDLPAAGQLIHELQAKLERQG